MKETKTILRRTPYLPAVSLALFVLGAILTPPSSLYGQEESTGYLSSSPETSDNSAVAMRYAARIPSSVVLIRTTAVWAEGTGENQGNDRSLIRTPLKVHGTGLVIGSAQFEGRSEYLILTNHHVADPSNYVVQEGRFFRENRHNSRAVPTTPEQSFLILPVPQEEEGEVNQAEADTIEISLIEISRSPEGDMALLRTVRAPDSLPFTIYEGPLGLPGRPLQKGDRVVTTGYPMAGPQATYYGEVEAPSLRHVLGIPHTDASLSVPARHGQSGSPVFLIQQEANEDGYGAEPHFTLIGMLHAHENHTTFMTPYDLWRGSLEDVPGLDAERLSR